MATTIDMSIKRLQTLMQNYNSNFQSSFSSRTDECSVFINDIIQQLNNLKSHIEPVNIKITNNASNLASVMGAQIQCSFGIGPGSYIGSRFLTNIGQMPSSNITDSKLGVNLLPFSGCSSPTNPFFKPPFIVPPLPCIPTITSFIPTNPTILLENSPVTTINSKGICTFAPGGVISFSNAGQNSTKTE